MPMALKFREEVVGKRFLALLRESSQFEFEIPSTLKAIPKINSTAESLTETDHNSFTAHGGANLHSHKNQFSNINSTWDITACKWISGVVRAASDKDITCQDSQPQILVEFDHCDWQKRDWLKVHEDFSVLLVEETLVISQRSHPEKPTKKCWWPALTFKVIVDSIGATKSEKQPVEFLVDQTLSFVAPSNLSEYTDGNRALDQQCREAATRWTEYQDGQRILVSTPTVLVGFRVKVYRTEGTTQWFTAVIQQYNDSTKELSLLDDTVLEEHCESAELTQIIPLDGVVETILKGTESRIVPRRRAKEQGNSKEPAGQSTQASSTSNQAIKTSKPINSLTTPTASRGELVKSVTSVSANKTHTKKAGSGSYSQDSATNKQPSLSKKELSNLDSAAAVTTAPTSVIRHTPRPERRLKRLGKSDKPTSLGAEIGSRKSRKTSNHLTNVSSSSQSKVLSTLSIPGSKDVIDVPLETQSVSSEQDSLPDMHIKKQRILSAVSESKSKQPFSNIEGLSESDINGASTSSTTGVIVRGSGDNTKLLPPVASTVHQSSPLRNLGHIGTNNQAEKLSESSIDGCSSGYSSATTTDSTVSPQDKDGLRNPSAALIVSSNPSPKTSSAPTSVVTENSFVKQLGISSPHSLKAKPGQEYNSSSVSPLVGDPPLVPYRDPELLKRDAEVRKMAHTPSGSQPPTSRSIPAASAAMPALAQQSAPPLPAAAALPAAAMLNPQVAHHLQMQQLMQQYQMMEQIRQLQAIQTLNPLQQYSILQQQQLAAQQQLALGGMFDRQPRPCLPTNPAAAAAAQWMMMPQFSGDKPLLSDLQREHELRLDQKERADRAERQKLAKEKAEKERLDKEKEKQQMHDRQERARILKESALLAQDAVNQHFSESLRRMPHTTTTPPVNPSPNPLMMNMWSTKKQFMGAGDSSVQPQDLSISNKNKESARQDKEREQQFHAALSSQNMSISEEKQKAALSRPHETLMRSIQTGSSGQQSSSPAKLVDEHFMKAGLAQLPPKSELTEYSLYGYQSQSFPYKYVSRDQLQRQLCEDEKIETKDIKPPIQTLAGKDLSKPTQRSTPPRTASQPTGSHAIYSNQLIQEGLIPNPVYNPRVSVPGTVPTNDASSSISALVSMSMQAGNHLVAGDRYSKDSPQTSVKSQPGLPARSSQSMSLPSTTSSANTSTYPQSFKSFVETAVTQAFYKDMELEEQKKKSSPPRSPTVAVNPAIKSEKTNNGTMDTDSDTLSAPSPTLSVKTESQEAKPCHPKMKLKKEWLQRHTECGVAAPTSSSSPTSQTASAPLLNNSSVSNLSETTTSASETEAENQGIHKHKSKKRKSDSLNPVANGQSKKTKNSEVSSSLQHENTSRSSGSSAHNINSCAVKPAAGGDGIMQCSYNDEQNSIKQLADIAFRADRMEAVPYASKPLVRTNIATLKKTLQPFVQDGSCIEMAPKLTKCRECKLSTTQRIKKTPNIFCRFYAFRMLKFSRNGQISIAGFCDISQAEPDDITIWLPHIATKSRKLLPQDVKNAKYIISNVGEEFCRLVEQEQECISWSNTKRVWKRAVQGVREMCDLCDTTLFNVHWVCHRCGYVVCIDCYRVKRKMPSRTSNGVFEEHRKWLPCMTGKNHEPDKLMLTSIIPADALKITRDLIHHVRRKHSIKSSCICTEPPESSDTPKSVENINQELSIDSAPVKVPIVNSTAEGRLSLSYPQDVYRQSTYLSASLDNKTLNTYSDDPLSLLADVAAMAPSTNGPGLLSEVKVNGTATVEDMDTGGGEKKPCTTLRKLLTRNQANGNLTSDKQVHEIVNTAMDTAAATQKRPLNTGPKNHHEFAHYQRRNGTYLSGRVEAIPTCYLKETSLQYPDIKHSWMCEGKLLILHDPQHPNNFQLFNQRWTLGQPVIVSNVSKHMKVEELWTPEAFSKDFGHDRPDLIDCRRNEPLNGYQIKCFWDGFEDQSKRLTDADGQPLILKLKDWPTSEDFAESMPSRFQDLMSALPMPQYTQRNGQLNLAGRLPEFFVKPDLGPKMYIAYGLAKYPQSGTTNLHLDVSDAVNVMVFVAHEKELEPDVMKLIEDSDCDELMKKRITDDGEIPGALWHIYDACDADKMRDLLNKVALELGMELEPYHDPIHDQQFYLDKNLRQRLADEYGVYGYPILQCVGDAVFIPAGAPHQVQNLNGCVKVAEDFVSPEHLHHCFNLTQEFRLLSNTHANHEDKLQVKNIIYHAIKDAVAVLDQSESIEK